jgi:hypothetical protein
MHHQRIILFINNLFRATFLTTITVQYKEIKNIYDNGKTMLE